MLADVIDEQSADSTSIVSGGDGAIPLLTGRVPNLCLDCFGVHLNRPCRELNADGGFRIKIELVSRKPTQQIGLANPRVSDEDDWRRSARDSLRSQKNLRQ